MQRKPYRFVLLIIGLLLLFFGATVPLFRFGAVNLIGTNPVARFFGLLSLWNGLPLLLVALGVALSVFSAVRLLFPDAVAPHLHTKTTAMALGLSAVGIWGLLCAFLWFTITAFHEASKHPILYPFSVACGMLCLTAFCVLAVLYIRERIHRPSAAGVLLDILSGLLFLPAFFFGFTFLYATFS